MATVSEQIKSLPPDWGRPVAAVNGDFYHNSKNYPGDPDGLQIARGELVSAPVATRACFWIDASGNPHRGEVQPLFKVIWPDGSSTPIGLNEERGEVAAVLYTSAIDDSTRTSGGLELVLQQGGTGAGQKLQVGQSHTLRVTQWNSTGNSPMQHGWLVLSLGPKILAGIPKISLGATVTFSTATQPELTGVKTGVGGGPTLVAARHPRTAIGWNNRFIFLVEVDGRQPGLSVGMTFSELAEQMIKLGCDEAINLDGGGSATCWFLGNVMNSPSEGQERPGANSLVVLQKPKP